jgi:hypothetical protein
VPEFLLTAPAMTTAQMPDAKTMKYDILYSVNADLSAPTTYITAAITQTGAGGVGCAAATFRFRLPSDALRYVGFKARPAVRRATRPARVRPSKC